MTKFRLANPHQNKESKQKKQDKGDERNANECLFNASLCSSWNVADPIKPLNSYSAQINFDITIWNGSCSAMHDHPLVTGVKRKRINWIL